MSSDARAIVTVGVNPQRKFGPYHERFEKTLGLDGPFSRAHGVRRWDHDWPPGSPAHSELHYGFKIYAIRDALAQGFTSILWLDVSCFAVASLEPLWKEIETEGHWLGGEPELDHSTGFVTNEAAAQTMDRLGCWSSDKALEAFGLSRDDAMRVTLLTGTCIGLDFTHARSRAFFEKLSSFAVPGHYNGTHSSGLLGDPTQPTEGKMMSTDPRCQGHRSDEVYMTLIARELKMKTSGEIFTGGNAIRPSTVIRSGYDL